MATGRFEPVIRVWPAKRISSSTPGTTIAPMASSKSFHDSVDTGFRSLGRGICAHPWRVIAGSLAFTGLFCAFLPSMQADFSSDSYLLPGDQARQRFDAFRDRFGLDDRTVVALEPKEVFDLEFLATLRELHRRIEDEMPRVEEVLSLVNARDTRGEGDELIVEDLLEDWPENEADLAALREKVLANPTYRNTLISEDARYTVILVRLETYSSLDAEIDVMEGFEAEGTDSSERPAAYLTGGENDLFVSALYDLVAEYESADLTIRLAGEGVLGHRATLISSRDTVIFFGLSMLIIVGVLYILFRRIAAATLPLLVVTVSVGSTFGAMAALGIPFSIPTQIIPNFLIAVGVCDSVHILTIFYQAVDRGERREDAIVHALGHSGLAVVLTSLTTAGGLFSFIAAEITPVARLGMIAPIGVMLTLLFTVTLLPALLAVTPASVRVRKPASPSRAADGAAEVGLLTRGLVATGMKVVERPKTVLALTSVLVLVSASGVAQLRFSHHPMDWLLPDDPVRVAVARMDAVLKGISPVEILIDTGRENGLYDPEFLRGLEEVIRHALALREGPVPVGTATSVVDIVKEINQALNGNDPAAYRIPGERALVAQELLLFENSGSDDLLQVTDSLFQTARLTLRVPLVDAFHYGPFLADLDAKLKDTFDPNVGVEITGATVLGNRAFSVVLTSLVRSYALALLIITPLMILMIGSLRLGLMSMIPNLLPVYVTLALMGWLDIPLSITTLLMGSIIIGLAVDDTIHFLHKFDRYHRDCGDARQAVRKTLETTGTALLTTSLVLVFGFGIFYVGSMTGIVLFGVLASFGTAVAFLADILVSPALLILVKGKRQCAPDPLTRS